MVEQSTNNGPFLLHISEEKVDLWKPMVERGMVDKYGRG